MGGILNDPNFRAFATLDSFPWDTKLKKFNLVLNLSLKNKRVQNSILSFVPWGEIVTTAFDES